MDGTIILENMEFRAFHGCYDLEKVVGNNFLVSVEIIYDMRAAALSDDISKSINYLQVYQAVEREMKTVSDILENVAYRIIHAIRKEFEGVKEVRAKVSKLAPPLGGKVEKVSVILAG